MNNKRIVKNLHIPTNNNDVVIKKYFDNNLRKSKIELKH